MVVAQATASCWKEVIGSIWVNTTAHCNTALKHFSPLRELNAGF